MQLGRGRSWSIAIQILDILIRFRYTRGHIPKWSEIAPIFPRFCPPNFLGCLYLKNLYVLYVCSRGVWAKIWYSEKLIWVDQNLQNFFLNAGEIGVDHYCLPILDTSILEIFKVVISL